MNQLTATASIDRTALINNFNAIKTLAPNTKVMAVLKANAYGHGLVRIAKWLPQADAFGVARIDEALELRAGGVVKPIVLLEGFFNPGDLEIIAVNNFQTIIHNKEQLLALEKCQLNQPIQVWLKIDTGMHRLGINPEQFDDFYRRLQQCSIVQSNIKFMSHLACADDLNSVKTEQQISLFNKLTEHLPGDKTLANSAGLCALPQTHFQWIRPGLMMYGISPLENHQPLAQPLQPVMTLHSSLISVRDIKEGDTIGYGATWQAPKDTRIGVVAIGYGDGYPRHAQNGTPVLVNGRIVPLVGRVSMDMITVDLGADANDIVGDCVELWGKQLSVTEIAKFSGTIAYELLCNITRRVKIDVI